jgi:hypothetical protein
MDNGEMEGNTQLMRIIVQRTFASEQRNPHPHDQFGTA